MPAEVAMFGLPIIILKPYTGAANVPSESIVKSEVKMLNSTILAVVPVAETERGFVAAALI